MRTGVWVPVGAVNFSLHHRVQTGSGAHPTSNPMGTTVSFPGDKAAGAWSWPLTSIYCRGRGAILPLLNTPSWRDDQLKHRDNFTLSMGILTNCFNRVRTRDSTELVPRTCSKATTVAIIHRLNLSGTKIHQLETRCPILKFSNSTPTSWKTSWTGICQLVHAKQFRV